VCFIKSKRVRWVGHVALMGEIRNAYIIFIGKLGMILPWRHRHRWEYNIRMEITEIW
jgi:hypothetical protein